MEKDTIKCPKCQTEIPIGKILKHQAEEQIAFEVKEKLAIQREKIAEELKEKFSQEQTDHTKKLKEQLDLETKKRREAETKELDFIKKQTELEDKIKHSEIEIARRLQEERKLITEKAQKEVAEKFSLQNRDLKEQLESTKKALNEAQRKAEQGSMQTQGESLELALEEMLKQNFPGDIIEPVPKGICGADIVQKVVNKTGEVCGVIVWESKRTKAWTEEWVQKLKDDSRAIRANIAVLVSETLPKNINHLGAYSGIWVCDFSSALGLTTALRSQLIAVSKTQSASIGKEQKMEVLYNYLTSQTFAQRVEAIVETFSAMKNNLEKEKIAMQKIWASREIQIVRLTDNTAKMYGEIQGIAGSKLPTIEILELESAAEEQAPPDNTKKKKEVAPNNQSNLF